MKVSLSQCYWAFLCDMQVARQLNLNEALGLTKCQARGSLSVAALCCLREDTTVIITEGKNHSALLLELWITGAL